MTRINKLTQNKELNDDDLFVIYDDKNDRTRSISSQDVKGYMETSGFTPKNLSPNTVPLVNSDSTDLIDSSITETANSIIFTKDIIAPQESVFVGPAVKISDKGGYLGIDNIADDRESTPAVSFVYETEAERDAIFSDGVSVPKYRFFVPAKWVNQFPFTGSYSNTNKVTFEFKDTDNTLIRKFRLFSQKAQTGVRIWIENLLPGGDALVWENVTEEDFAKGKGADLVAQGDNDTFTEIHTGLVKISTANIRFRFCAQAQQGETLELEGTSIDIGYGEYFYPRLISYTQDEKDISMLDFNETGNNRFGEFGKQFRINASDIVSRSLGAVSDVLVQPVFDTLIDADRPEATFVNGDKPIQINSITVKHSGTWSPVQVSLNDDRTESVSLVDGDNTITFKKGLTVEANEAVYFRFSGFVGEGSQSQISLLGNSEQDIYYAVNQTEIVDSTIGTGDMLKIGKAGEAFSESEFLEFADGFELIQTGSGKGGKTTVVLPFAVEQELSTAEYGDFNADAWYSLENVRFLLRAKREQLSNSPINVYDYDTDPEALFVLFGLNQIEVRDGQQFRTMQVYCSFGSRTEVYVKSGFQGDSFNTGEWMLQTGTLIERPQTGTPSITPAGKLQFKHGVKAFFQQGDTVEISSTSFLSNPTDMNDFKVSDNNFRLDNPNFTGTIEYLSDEFDSDDIFKLNLDPADVPEFYYVTVTNSSRSLTDLAFEAFKDSREKRLINPGGSIIIYKRENGFEFLEVANNETSTALPQFNNVLDNTTNYLLPTGKFITLLNVIIGLPGIPNDVGQLYIEVENNLNYDLPELTKRQYICVKYTVIKHDLAECIGRTFIRAGKDKESFQAAPIREITDTGGNTGVIDLDMSLDNSRTLDNTFVGKLANLIQSQDISVVGQISIDTHDKFNLGDVLTIAKDETYTNYYFAVYYSNAIGQQKAVYPSNNITLVRTSAGWDVSLGGTFTNTLISPPSQTTFSGDPITDNTRPVSGFVFVNRDGVEYVKDDSGRDLIKVDVGAGANTDPTQGFNLQSGATINVVDGSTINLAGDMTFPIDGGVHNLLQPLSDGIAIGTNQKQMNFQFRNDGGDVTLQRAGSTHTFAFEDNTIGGILAGDNIAIDDSNPRFPKITATGGGGGGEDPSLGFTLNDNTSIRFPDSAKMLLQYDGGTHTLLDFSYDGVGQKYFTQFGAIGTEFQIKTLNRPSVSENAGGFFTIAYDEENHIPDNEWERSTQARNYLVDEMYNYFDFIFEPFGEGHIAHLVMPSRDEWESKFYIAGVNEDKKNHLPEITHFRLAFTIPDTKIAKDENHKLRLSSKDGLTNFDQDGTDIITGVRGKRWLAMWARPKESAPSGWAGWVLKFSPDIEDDFVSYTQYQAQGNVAYTGIPSNQQTRVIDGVGYISIDRQAPVKTTDDSTDGLVLIQLNAAESDTDLATVRKVSPGTLASGFSLCPDGTAKDTQIIQIASGTYSLEQMSFAVNAGIGDGVYVGSDGKLTLQVTEYQAGWVILNGVVIDIDIYNRNLNNEVVDTFDTLTTRVLKVHEGPDAPETFTQVAIDGNKNTNIHAVGDTHYYRKDPSTGDLTEIYQIDNSNSFVVKNKIKNPVITNLSSGSTNSNSEKSAFIDFRNESKINIGAYERVSITIAGEKTTFGGNTITFDDTGDGYIRNLGLLSRNSTNEKNSIRLNDGEIVYKSNSHSFVDDSDNNLYSFNQTDFNFYNRNLKQVRHVVGNTPTSMFVANVSLIKRDDGENDKDVIDFATDQINIKSKKVEFNDDSGARRLTIANHKADWHSCQLNNIADGEADNDAATVGQLNAIASGGGIPFLRKFDSTGGTIYAHSYQENRIASWINYKGDGSKELALDAMRKVEEGKEDEAQQYDNVVVDNQSVNVCKLRLFYEGTSVVKRILPGEIIQCWTSREFKRWKWIYGSEDSPTSFTSLAIEENNDEIITPTKGNQFQIVDSEKSASYGNANKQVTYFAPTVGTQSATLLNHLDYGKAWAIHEEVNTTKLILIMHESLVSEIYDRDLTDVTELTMLFTGDSRGRLGKANQTADPQFAINWNGELIPATESANELNPTQWIAPDDSVTETWSTGVKSVCYSTGVLANRGSAMLKRGDVIYSKPQSLTDSNEPLTEQPKHLSNTLTDSGETAQITYDDASEFFVMPIIAGGGTFNVMKLFQFFMSRKTQYVEDWGSIRFEQSSDCIGTILKIAYDAAIAEEERQEENQTQIQTELFKMAAKTVSLYPDQKFVIDTED